MNRARVVVASDRLSAEVQIGPGAPTTATELRTALAAAGVVHGIDDLILVRLGAALAEAHATARTIVARGFPPQPGHDGRLELAFATAKMAGHNSDDDSIDYRERAFLHPAAVGTEVARIVPPEAGIDGRDVLGRTLPAPPVRPATLRLGSGVALQPDGRVLAIRDGVVTTPAGAIDVLPLYTHHGDVDLHSGNLHSHGSLLVSGDLHAGFQIEADGDVAVQGSSFGGTILAGGRVDIGLGVQAGSRIEAGGDLHCRHATSSTLCVDGALHIRDEAVHCRLAAASIELLEGRGHALGGELRARTHVAVVSAGSASGAPTLLAAGDLTSAAGELVRRTHQLERLQRQGHKLGDRQHAPHKGGKFGRQHTAAADAAQAEKIEQARRQRELLRAARVVVKESAHLGVRIQLGNATLTLPRDSLGATFRWDEATHSITQEPT